MTGEKAKKSMHEPIMAASEAEAPEAAPADDDMHLMPCHESPTKHFVHTLINWKCVEQRLEHYSAIGEAFPIDMLRTYEERPPYYCHYMAWRLGTWSVRSEGCLANLDNLLASAAELPNWEHEASALKKPEYGTYWSLLWQLQVAARLGSLGQNVKWGGPAGGPDLSVKVDGRRWHVECYAPQKSYSLLQFLQELLSKILRSSVQTDYRLFSEMSLPKEPKSAAQFLDDKLEPYCDASRREEASEGPKDVTVVYGDPCSVEVADEGWETSESDDTVEGRRRPGESEGSPEQHVTTMLREAVSNKEDSNSLRDHHPNVLAVNLLLTDAEAAEYPDPEGNMIVRWAPELPAALDVLAVDNCGIDASMPNLRIAACRSPDSRRDGRWLEAERDDKRETRS